MQGEVDFHLLLPGLLLQAQPEQGCLERLWALHPSGFPGFSCSKPAEARVWKEGDFWRKGGEKTLERCFGKHLPAEGLHLLLPAQGRSPLEAGIQAGTGIKHHWWCIPWGMLQKLDNPYKRKSSWIVFQGFLGTSYVRQEKIMFCRVGIFSTSPLLTFLPKFGYC